MREKMMKVASLVLAASLFTGCSLTNTASGTLDASGGAVVSGSVAMEDEAGEKESFRYVSEDYFYTGFEGKSVVQTDEEYANTICQRTLHGELTDSYQMGTNFGNIFYVDENWLYYSELTDVDPDADEIDWDEISDSVSVYRVPLSHKEGKEIPEFSQKEFLFTESDGLGGSDFSENAFLQLTDDTIYYFAGNSLGTYNLKSKEQKHYSVQDKKEDYMNAAGTRYMIAEGKNQSDVLTDLETGKSEVMKTDRHPWLRIGKEYYFRFPYSPFTAGGILLDLNSGETIEVLSQKEGERVAEEMELPLDKDWLSEGDWDGMSIDYIGYFDHRVYAAIQYPTMVKDKKGRKIRFWDAVCVSRNMDEKEGWTIEQEITAHARKEILKYYKQVEEGSYKIEKDEDGEIAEDEVVMGEGIANGIFYFDGLYKKDGKLSKDIYDLRQKEFRVIGRNSPETFYPFYDNSHKMMYDMHAWQDIRQLAPIMSQTEEVWDQEQKLSQK